MQGLITKWNPVAAKAFFIKWGLVALVTMSMVGAAYMHGLSNGKKESKLALQKVATQIAERRANNAGAAIERYAQYATKDRELEMAIADSLNQIHDFYAEQAANNSARKVRSTELIPVPGEKEYVYVPDGACPNDFLSPDELQLFNWGNKRGDLDPGNSK